MTWWNHSETISPTLNYRCHLSLSLSHCGIRGLEDIPLTAQTNRLFPHGGVCAHICLVLTKNDKPRGLCTSVVTENTRTYLPPSDSNHSLNTHSILLPGLKWDTTYVYTFFNCSCNVEIQSPKWSTNISGTAESGLVSALLPFLKVMIMTWFYKFKLCFLSIYREAYNHLPSCITRFSKPSVFVDVNNYRVDDFQC